MKSAIVNVISVCETASHRHLYGKSFGNDSSPSSLVVAIEHSTVSLQTPNASISLTRSRWGDSFGTVGSPSNSFSTFCSSSSPFEVSPPTNASVVCLMASRDDWVSHINKDSEIVLPDAMIEQSLVDKKVEDHVQFERLGYFVVDKDSANRSQIVYNRTCPLKSN